MQMKFRKEKYYMIEYFLAFLCMQVRKNKAFMLEYF